MHLKSTIRRTFQRRKGLNINPDDFIRSSELLSDFNGPSALAGTQVEDGSGVPDPSNMISIHEKLEGIMLSVYYTDLPLARRQLAETEKH